MDSRWQEVPLNSKKDARVYLHKSASLTQIRTATYAVDQRVDLSPYVEQGSHSFFDCNVTLKWNYQLFGTSQPQPGQNLEVQLLQNGQFQTIWIGTVEALNSFTMSRGERSMQLIARVRDSQKVWRETKRVTKIYPQLSDLSAIIREIASTVGLEEEEIVISESGISTSHTNTQLADMSAWEMITQLAIPLKATPYIDQIGRLRLANRDLMGVQSTLEIPATRVVRIGAQRQKTPCTRFRVQWLDPTLKKSKQIGRKLADASLTTGWFLPFIKKDIQFSQDKTQRAENTYMRIKHSANLLKIFCTEKYVQVAENEGKITLTNRLWLPTIAVLVGGWFAAHSIPDIAPPTGGPVAPVGRRIEAGFQLALMGIMMLIGTGVYEIWGTPFEWVHARNTTEAFDADSPNWVDNPDGLETDFIMNEQHAQSIAVTELVYKAQESNKWDVSIIDDPRIEYGDVLEFEDGSKVYVEDLKREFARGSDTTLEIRGFMVGDTAVAGQPIGHQATEIPAGSEDIPGDTGGGDGEGGSGLGQQAPNVYGTIQSVEDGGSWNLEEWNEDAPNGRGAFTEAVVNALHGSDPRWGHIRKSEGQNQYNGHAVDAIIWKNPDNVTAEIFDIVSGSGDTLFGFVDRSSDNLGKWYY